MEQHKIPDKVKNKVMSRLNIITEKCIVYKPTNQQGYGEIQYNDKKTGKKCHYRAHRIAFQLYYNCTLLASDIILHSCDNPACINPKHLSKGSHNDNVQDKVKKGRQAKGENNGRYSHGHYSKYAPVPKPIPEFQSICNRSLSLELVKAIKNRIAQKNCTLKVLAKEFDIKYDTIRDISSGRTYNNL